MWFWIRNLLSGAGVSRAFSLYTDNPSSIPSMWSHIVSQAPWGTIPECRARKNPLILSDMTPKQRILSSCFLCFMPIRSVLVKDLFEIDYPGGIMLFYYWGEFIMATFELHTQYLYPLRFMLFIWDSYSHFMKLHEVKLKEVEEISNDIHNHIGSNMLMITHQV